MPATRRPPWLMPLIIVAAWTLVAASDVAQQLATRTFNGGRLSSGELMAYPVLQALTFALLTPFLLYAVTRIAAGRGVLGVLLLLPVIGAIALVKLVIDWMLVPVVANYPIAESGLALYRRLLLVRFPVTFLIGSIIAGLYIAVANYERYRDRELRARDLEARLAQAQLTVLEMQLNPHFLFNSLQSIAELTHSDPEAAERMIERLSDLLRLSLSRFGVHELTLREEIDFLERYLAIEEIRFSDRLRVELDIAPDALDAAVPNLVLQPLVENALKHGVAQRVEPCRVRIAARRTASELMLEVADEGPGLAAARQERVGLANVRARLEQLFGGRHRFLLTEEASGGVRAEVAIPFRVLGHES